MTGKMLQWRRSKTARFRHCTSVARAVYATFLPQDCAPLAAGFLELR